MMYPIQLKLYNKGNAPITITGVETYQVKRSDGEDLVMSSLYNQTQSPYYDQDILPKSSKIINTRAYIDDETIINSENVYIQARVKIQGHNFPEMHATVFVFSLQKNGSPAPIDAPRIPASFQQIP